MLPADAPAPPEVSDDRTTVSVLEALHAQTYRQTDRLFGVLLLIQYGAGLVLALTVAPGAGIGLLLLSTLVMLGPAALAFTRPGRAATRYAVAAGQMLASALLIHLTGGRLESHFHVLASLGVLALYRDWAVLALAGGVSLADHIARGLADPLSLFGTEDAPPWRVLEHAWWIVVTAGFLIIGCRWAARQLREGVTAHANARAAHEQNDQALRQAREQEAMLATQHDELQTALRDLEEQRVVLHTGAELMMEHMNAFADGDLSVQLPDDQRDAFGRLYQGFNHALGNVRAMLKQVTHVVEQTVAAAAQISASAEELAVGSQHQSMQATEVAVAVEEMTATIIENARNASHTSTLATENGRMAREGREVVDQTVQKIRQIASVVRSSSETIERLGASSNEIGAIVSVINEIADQTNLLALNAAIEAARAGEHGRGFAVVADEVRQLAERTTTATKQIAEMIATIQSDTDDAVSAMQQGNQEVEEGIRLADSAGDALARIVSGVEESIDVVNQIAAASEEQSTTSEEIARNVETISNVSSEAATGIGQIAQGSETLTGHMRQLQRLLNQFRLDAPSHASPPSSHA